MAQDVLDWLVEQFPAAKRQTLRRMAAAGRVWVNGKPEVRVNRPVSPSDVLSVVEAAPQRAARSSEARLRRWSWQVIHEDDDLLVVNKPSGLLTSTVPHEPRATLLAQVRDYLAEREPRVRVRARVGLIHRLDRDASGLLVFSKNDEAYHALKTQFYHHEAQRVYAAVVRGTPRPATGRIESDLAERTDGRVHSTHQIGKGQHAITDYEVQRSAAGMSLLRVTLHTGRKHQIRVHLSERGWPIVGDILYGPEKAAPKDRPADQSLLLAAVKLSLSHPRTGQPMTFEIDSPAALAQAV